MFDNDDPDQRNALIAELQSAGLQAGEWDSGGGITHVVVPLLDPYTDPPAVEAEDVTLKTELSLAVKTWPYEASLYVATNSLQTACEIGLLGSDGRTGRQAGTVKWQPVESIDEAASVFQQFWKDRDQWLRAYLVGEISL